MVSKAGLLKRSPFRNQLKHVAFSTPTYNKNHHVQGNVQVYNVRIPAKGTPKSAMRQRVLDAINRLTADLSMVEYSENPSGIG